MTRWQWALRLLTRRMWFRASLFCVFAVVLALAGALIGHAISYDFASKVGAKSVDNILNVLASSMLAVTTFSFTAMVSAYSGATSNITPRAVQLLIQDSTAQNALATFLGSFLFAIVGIIALSTGLYGETGRVILYAGTILVIVVIVVTFVRWIEHIARFGRVSDTVQRVERAAMNAVHGMAQRPRFGPRERIAIPDSATKIHHSGIGRVTYVDLAQLAEVAEEAGGDINLVALPGTLVDPARLLAWTTASLDDKQVRRIRDAFTIEYNRTFDHDPRFGLVVLSEIASRALSPAVNDPGTAIAVIEAGTRVMARILRHEPDPNRSPPAGVNVRRLPCRTCWRTCTGRSRETARAPSRSACGSRRRWVRVSISMRKPERIVQLSPPTRSAAPTQHSTAGPTQSVLPGSTRDIGRLAGDAQRSMTNTQCRFDAQLRAGAIRLANEGDPGVRQ